MATSPTTAMGSKPACADGGTGSRAFAEFGGRRGWKPHVRRRLIATVDAVGTRLTPAFLWCPVPRMPTLKIQIEALAKTFAAQVLTAIRSSSLEEILGQAVAPRTTRTAKGAKAPKAPSAAKAPRRRGRLARRSVDQIQTQLASVVALLKKSPKGLRSEEIRNVLKLDRREVPRVLAEGLKSKAVRKTGAKRATNYKAN